MFQQILDTLGQLDGNYQRKTPVTATLLEVKAVEYSQSSGKPKQGLYVQADDGDRAWLNLIGKFDPVDVNNRNRFDFLVWPFKAEQSPKPSLYCWIQRAAAGQAPPSEPYHVPVGQPQAPPQAPNTPVRTRDATGVSIERQATVKAVCERYAGTDADLATMLDACGHFHKWIETGTVDFTVMNTPAPIMTDPNQDDSDLPPELRADYPG